VISVDPAGTDQLTKPGPAPGRSRLRQRIITAGKEFALIVGLYLLYRMGRILIVGQEATARANAGIIHRDEAWLHLPSEALIQAELGSQALYRLANLYYVSFHFPVMIAFLILGYLLRPRREYRWARNLIAVQTGLALIIHIVFPLAPPRMFAGWGFVDTMTVYGPSAYSGAAATAANQFAAMPSLHVGWAVLIAYVVARTGPRWLAILAGLHALATVAVVIVTANHWWLDGVVSIGLLGVALAVFPQPGQNRLAGLLAPNRATARPQVAVGRPAYPAGLAAHKEISP
jgi:hypothetical protein